MIFLTCFCRPSITCGIPVNNRVHRMQPCLGCLIANSGRGYRRVCNVWLLPQNVIRTLFLKQQCSQLVFAGLVLPAVFLVITGYIGCNHVLAIAMLTLAVGTGGFAMSGFSPHFINYLTHLKNNNIFFTYFCRPCITSCIPSNNRVHWVQPCLGRGDANSGRGYRRVCNVWLQCQSPGHSTGVRRASHGHHQYHRNHPRDPGALYGGTLRHKPGNRGFALNF